MFVTNELLEQIEDKAKLSPKLRANFCLHKLSTDSVQKMVNVLLPGTVMPIHRHLYTDELIVLIRGKITIIFFDNEGHEMNRFILSSHDGIGINIPLGQWHNVLVEEPAAVFEIKTGPYRPLDDDKEIWR